MSSTLQSSTSSASSGSANFAPKPRPASTGNAGKLFVTAIVIVLAAGTLYFGADYLRGGDTISQDFVLHDVKRQDIDIVVVERGSLESGKNVDLVCEVEARSPNSPSTTIISIIKEGSQVKKGDLLVELDSASLIDQITTQKIKVEQARATLIREQTNLDITRSQNESDIQSAQIAVELAEIDLKKYVEGDYKQEKRNIDGENVIAEEELNRAKERLDYSERLSKKGYVSASEVEADRLAVTKAQNALNVAKEKLRVLDEYTKPRTVKDLDSKREEATRKLERVKNEAKAKEAQAESAMLAQKGTFETEEATLRRLERQLEKCKIYSPTDGMVVYANDPGASMRGQPQVQIEEGASVRERQKIIRIPDLDSMQVNVKVHEAKVSHVKPGQAARVRVESLPDRSYSGTVRTVATTADSQSWFSSGVQVYTVMVSVDEKVEGLKPGMTAEVEIFADRLSDVVAVPVQAIVERHGQNYCYVLEQPGQAPTPRRVEVGPSNDKVVAIEKGLDPGTKILENVSAVINEEELGAIAKADAEKYAPEETATPKVAQTRPGGPAGAANGNGPAGNGDAPKQAPSGKSAGGSGLLTQLDKNNDGKLSLADEVPEDRKAMFTPMDTNGDGFIDGSELAASRARRGGGSGAPGGGGFQMPATGAEWIKASDKNADGKVAKDELPEFVQQFFATMDTNGDGFVDGTEADGVVERMKAMREQGGFGGGRPGAPPGGAQ